MQTSRYESEDGFHRFGLETAVTQIAAKGYYLFVGSIKLLETRAVPRSATAQVSINV